MPSFYEKTQHTKDCVWCGTEFTTGHSKKKYCTVLCRSRSRNAAAMKEKDCEMCKSRFETRTKRQLYCGPICRARSITAQKDKVYMAESGYDYIPKSGDRGSISELRVMTDLLSRGYMVFRNCSKHGSTDIIALWPGPYQVPLRFEVKTVTDLSHSPTGRYEQDKYFDHWAKVTHTGEIRYVPDLPKQETPNEDQRAM